MNKKPILSKRPKKFIIFLLVCLITITLAGCDSSNKMPTGDIDLDAVYATGGGQQVTVGEVYNKLRYNAVDYLETLVYNFLYEEEIKTLTDDLYKEDGTVNEDSKYLERPRVSITTFFNLPKLYLSKAISTKDMSNFALCATIGKASTHFIKSFKASSLAFSKDKPRHKYLLYCLS